MKTVQFLRSEYFEDDDGCEYYGLTNELMNVGYRAAKELVSSGAAILVKGVGQDDKISSKHRAALSADKFGESEEVPSSRRQRRRQSNNFHDKSRHAKTRSTRR
jgi:hypothetical protein